MNWKVCGMRDPDNIQEVLKRKPTWLGFIFYPPSPRYVKTSLDCLPDKWMWPSETLRVGVFVSPTFAEVRQEVLAFQLHGVQWHGLPPSSEITDWLKEKNIFLIQVVSIGENFNLDELKKYEGIADYFLFDTQSPGHGGSGKTFDHSFLPNYSLSIPFLIAGGLNLPHIKQLPDLSQVPFWGVDVNSRFETSPGLKNIELISDLADYINSL